MIVCEVCSSTTEIKQGPYGLYHKCIKCGATQAFVFSEYAFDLTVKAIQHIKKHDCELNIIGHKGVTRKLVCKTCGEILLNEEDFKGGTK